MKSEWERPDGRLWKRSEKMFYMRQLGMTQEQIGNKLGLNKATVSNNLLRRERIVEWEIANASKDFKQTEEFLAISCYLKRKKFDELLKRSNDHASI